MIAFAALLMASAVALFIPASARSRLPPPPTRRRRVRSVVPLTTAVAAIGLFVVFEGWIGLAFAGLAVFGLPRLFEQLERRQRLRADAHLRRQVPQIADILAAALAAGTAIPNATRAVAAAMSDPARTALRHVVRAQELGADPIDAWQTAPEPLRPIGYALARAAQSGAAVSSVLAGVADDARRERRTIVEIAARAAGVRAVAPLAACFLPAFLLVGVIPVVVTLAEGLLPW